MEIGSISGDPRFRRQAQSARTTRAGRAHRRGWLLAAVALGLMMVAFGAAFAAGMATRNKTVSPAWLAPVRGRQPADEKVIGVALTQVGIPVLRPRPRRLLRSLRRRRSALPRQAVSAAPSTAPTVTSADLTASGAGAPLPPAGAPSPPPATPYSPAPSVGAGSAGASAPPSTSTGGGSPPGGTGTVSGGGGPLGGSGTVAGSG